jgi:hypothetical protein
MVLESSRRFGRVEKGSQQGAVEGFRNKKRSGRIWNILEYSRRFEKEEG